MFVQVPAPGTRGMGDRLGRGEEWIAKAERALTGRYKIGLSTPSWFRRPLIPREFAFSDSFEEASDSP